MRFRLNKQWLFQTPSTVPPTDQWVHAAQKPRPEKEAVGESPA